MPFLSSELDRPKYLKHVNATPPKKLRMASIAMENVGRGELKPVLHFVGTDLGLILNATNRRTIAEALGDDMLTWIGKVIVIFAEMVDFEGRFVPGVRVRVPKQKDPPAPVVVSPPNGDGAAHHTDRGEYLDDEPDPDELDNQTAYARGNAKLMGEEVDDDDVAF
jgi:hypothetical protein